MCILIVLNLLYQLISCKIKTTNFVSKIACLFIFLFVGFGPLLLNTTTSNFFNTKRLTIIKQDNTNRINHNLIIDLAKKYQKSLLVWVKEPTNNWYPDHKPIFPPPLFILMILGIIAGIIRKNIYLTTILCIALILHLTNSALTNIVNGEHRLGPLYPIGALFVGGGVAYIIEKIKTRSLIILFALSLCIFLLYQGSLFYINQPANINRDIGDYVSMHAIYFIQENTEFNTSNNINFLVSPSNYQKLNYVHYQEQYDFFFPQKNILIEKSNTVADNEINIKTDNTYLGKSTMFKCKKRNFYCPIYFDTDIYIHY